MIGKNIKELYNALGITQYQFAKMVGYTHSAISLLESGKTKKPSRGLIAAICSIKWPGHGYVNRDWLLTGKGKMFIDEPASAVSESWKGYYHYDESVCKAHPICQEICKLCHETPDDLKKEILEYIQFKQSLKPKRSVTGAKRGRRSA
jgi:transcriptional regulator with XRE-family HTH domain